MTSVIRYITTICMAGLLLQACNHQPAEKPFALQSGDLLFQDMDCGDMCTAIETVTQGWHGAKLSHVGIAVVDSNGHVEVLEAISKGVSLTPLSSFLKRSADTSGHPKVIVGRLNIPNSEQLAKDAVKRAMTYLGMPYDTVFNINNKAYYCSELVYFSYKDSLGNPLFNLKPMTFNEPVTGTVFPVWKSYFEAMHVPVPEGKPGINPGGISRSDKIDIIHVYGNPEGMEINTTN